MTVEVNLVPFQSKRTFSSSKRFLSFCSSLKRRIYVNTSENFIFFSLSWSERSPFEQNNFTHHRRSSSPRRTSEFDCYPDPTPTDFHHDRSSPSAENVNDQMLNPTLPNNPPNIANRWNWIELHDDSTESTMKRDSSASNTTPLGWYSEIVVPLDPFPATVDASVSPERNNWMRSFPRISDIKIEVECHEDALRRVEQILREPRTTRSSHYARWIRWALQRATEHLMATRSESSRDHCSNRQTFPNIANRLTSVLEVSFHSMSSDRPGSLNFHCRRRSVRHLSRRDSKARRD